jgi:hypothetical protein
MAESPFGRIQGQDLPDPLSGSAQKIRKLEGGGSEIPDAETRWQAEDGQQNTVRS